MKFERFQNFLLKHKFRKKLKPNVHEMHFANTIRWTEGLFLQFARGRPKFLAFRSWDKQYQLQRVLGLYYFWKWKWNHIHSTSWIGNVRFNLEKRYSIQICPEVHISQGTSVPRYIAGWCNYKYQIYRRKNEGIFSCIF